MVVMKAVMVLLCHLLKASRERGSCQSARLAEVFF